MQCLLLTKFGFSVLKILFIIEFGDAFYQVFVGARLHVTGGVLRGGRSVEGESAVAGIFQLLP